MFEKIKDLIKISESLDEIKAKVDDHSGFVALLNDEMKKFREELNLLKDNISIIKDKQSNLIDEFNENLLYMKELNNDFKKTIFDFSVLRKDIQSQILQKFDTKLNDELINHLDELKQNVVHYQDLKDKVSVIVQRINTLSEEISKFNEISKNIKKEDFELTKFTNQVLEMNKEKLDLMRRIDTLERLIAKMRRSQ